MVNEARAYRERVLADLERRTKLARQHIEELAHGRERLLQVFERARLVAVDVTAELQAFVGPDEFVNFAPTTGPVPLMVPGTTLDAASAPAAEPTDDRRRPSIDRRARPLSIDAVLDDDGGRRAGRSRRGRTCAGGTGDRTGRSSNRSTSSQSTISEEPDPGERATTTWSPCSRTEPRPPRRPIPTLASATTSLPRRASEVARPTSRHLRPTSQRGAGRRRRRSAARPQRGAVIEGAPLDDDGDRTGRADAVHAPRRGDRAADRHRRPQAQAGARRRAERRARHAAPSRAGHITRRVLPAIDAHLALYVDTIADELRRRPRPAPPSSARKTPRRCAARSTRRGALDAARGADANRSGGPAPRPPRAVDRRRWRRQRRDHPARPVGVPRVEDAAHRRPTRRRVPLRLRRRHRRHRRARHADDLDDRPDRVRVRRLRGQLAGRPGDRRRVVPDRSHVPRRPTLGAAASRCRHGSSLAARCGAPPTSLADDSGRRRVSGRGVLITLARARLRRRRVRSRRRPVLRRRPVARRRSVAATCSGGRSAPRSTLFVVFFLRLPVHRRAQPVPRRSGRADRVPGQRAPVRRALPRAVRAPPAIHPIRHGRSCWRSSSHCRRWRSGRSGCCSATACRSAFATRSSTSTSGSTCSSCRSSRSRSTGCSRRW